MLNYCDLHVHLGKAAGKPVKITASSNLTLERALDSAERVKGLNVIGIVDAVCSSVLEEIKELLTKGQLYECQGGGFKTPGGLLIIPGCEVEMEINRARVHFLVFLPGLEELSEFNFFLREGVKNPGLSTQFLRDRIHKVFPLVKKMGGHIALAHAFTPFKGFFGQLDSLNNLGGFSGKVDFIELGLSADSTMADQITELHSLPFIVGSDAHSEKNIGREYLEIDTDVKNFGHLFRIIFSGENIKSFRGFPPALGKYYKTRCRYCGDFPRETKGQVCSRCSKKGIVPGVSNRIASLSNTKNHPPQRPPYYPHLPLHLLPGFGPRTINSLYQNLGSEMKIIREIPQQGLGEFLNSGQLEILMNLRVGNLFIESGGAGSYGKVKKPGA